MAPSSTSKSSFNGILSSIRHHALASLLLGWIAYLHLSGLYLFTKGFLLTRLTLDEINTCSPSSPDCSITPRFDKAVVLIIDALRFDFISPNPSSPNDPNHHHILTLPAELTASDPTRSVIFHAHSDPPTTTLQRLKGITTGSLPTFVEAGSNFAGSAVKEDSWPLQLQRAGKKVGFMGDDTWLSVFPDLFAKNLSAPFESFNVEDLHTVDQGVIDNLLPLMEDVTKKDEWDVLIGHFLGVDHVGHRVGPSHQTMKAKLTQMNEVLRKVVDALDDNTLLMLLGDHGMDRKGDHGGDGELETSSALWFYSKKPSFTPSNPLASVPTYTLSGASVPARFVQQIDLVPSLSLLMGLPIPYNNLGSIIPELFSSKRELAQAFDINAAQVWRYLQSYRKVVGSGKEAKKAVEGLRRVWDNAGRVQNDLKSAEALPTPSIELMSAQQAFLLETLTQCRLLWAQFNTSSLLLGLCILLLSLPTMWTVYFAISQERSNWEQWAQQNLGSAFWGALGGGIVGGLSSGLGSVLGGNKQDGLGMGATVLYSAAFASELAILVPQFLPSIQTLRTNITRFGRPTLFSLIGPIILVIHCIGLSTNSFILWEDRITLYFLVTISLLSLAYAPAAPIPNLRLRLIGFSLLFATTLRLSGGSTICREENGASCSVSFYQHASTPQSPSWLLALSFPVAYVLPSIVGSFLGISKSYAGLAPTITGMLWRGVMLAGSVYWLFERGETWEAVNPARIPLLKSSKVWLARLVFVAVGVIYFVWYISPLCIEARRAGEETKTGAEEEGEEDNPLAPPKPKKGQLIVLGFANSFGSSYLLFLLPLFSLLWILAQPTGQIVLALNLVALLSFLELTDSQRDVKAVVQAFARSTDPAGFNGPEAGTILPPTFTEASTLALLSSLLFYTTGHQAVLSSIHWSTAFIGFPTLTQPIATLFVGLNTWGPLLLITLAVPLLGHWNVSPRPKNHVPVLPDSLKAILGYSIYQSSVAISTMTWAAWHRRHLMVWPVFAPRFMMAAVGLVVVDLGLVFAVGVGMRLVDKKVKKVFATVT
ncbi:Glycosylphosphatidylinositol anchor synthesis protein [Phaffia rhodozyma]|uniref:Glycosylphosphatidylinositol anchor synthesis protein n=1 Tax=Phaffia rhodozyma TaxID=264483 RepID=A0A0F7SN87_PHARH|nr:Glycosylphosphatidylinositol anchor synthesis protein [Phaffia rhodozyma]